MKQVTAYTISELVVGTFGCVFLLIAACLFAAAAAMVFLAVAAGLVFGVFPRVLEEVSR